MESFKYDSMEYFEEDTSELIITYVHNRPELWDMNSAAYKNVVAKKVAWMELAKELGIGGKFLYLLDIRLIDTNLFVNF